MRVARTASELHREAGVSVGLVPTMGAFHEGHLALMRAAKSACERVVVSLFVNPIQFGDPEDFARYPRDEKRDLLLAESAGVDTVFAPDAPEMIRPNTTRVCVAGVSDRWEGEHRPGHFDGVATIVAKLFNLVQPDVAFFGQKDYQQCLVIRKMVEDLGFPVSLRLMETVREPDGLAMSSRNRRLDPVGRERAPTLYREMQRASRSISALDPPDRDGIERVLRRSSSALSGNGFEVEYFELVDSESLEPLRGPGAGRIIAAARLSGIRLIDNTPVLISSSQ